MREVGPPTAWKPGLVRERSLARHEWVLLALICAVGLAVRVWDLGHQSLWMDEVLTVLSSRAPLASILLAPPVDPNIPPLYYALMWGLRGMGDGEVALRTPSVMAGVLSIPVLYSITATWLGRADGIVAATLLALSPLHVWYSQEARPYSILVLLGLLAVRSLQQTLRFPSRKAPRVAFVLLAAAAFYVHTVAVPFVAGLAIYLALVVPSRDRRGWLLTFLALVLLAGPGLYQLLRVPPTVSGNPAYVFQASHVAYTLWTFLTGYSLGPTLLELRTDGISAAHRHLSVIGPVLAFAGLLAVWGSIRLARARPHVLLALALWMVCPVGFVVLGAWLTSHPYNVRYTLLALPPCLILAAAGIHSLPRRGGQVVALGALMVISAVSLKGYYHDARYARDDNRGAAAFLLEHAAPNDLVIASAGYTRLPLQHYLGDADIRVVGYPGSVQQRLHDDAEGATLVQAALVEKDLARLIGERGGFWLFLSRTFHSDPEGHLQRYTDAHFKRLESYSGAGVQMVHYGVHATARE